jgi:hypothetical protein
MAAEFGEMLKETLDKVRLPVCGKGVLSPAVALSLCLWVCGWQGCPLSLSSRRSRSRSLSLSLSLSVWRLSRVLAAFPDPSLRCRCASRRRVRRGTTSTGSLTRCVASRTTAISLITARRTPGHVMCHSLAAVSLSLSHSRAPVSLSLWPFSFEPAHSPRPRRRDCRSSSSTP